MGYLAGKLFSVSRDTIAQVLFFLITPIIVLNGVMNTHLNMNILLLPFLTFAMSSGLCLGFYILSKRIWNDSTENLMAISAGTGNTGYFGLPVALLLFDDHGEGVYIMALLGVTLFENSLGFYVLAKGTYSSRECLEKLIKLPSLYAFILGLILNFATIHPPLFFQEFIGYMKGTYVVLGMMIIGLGLSTLRSLKLDFKYIGMAFLAKFAAWPLIALAVIIFDSYWLGFFNQTIYDVLLLISIVPVAANTVILAAIVKNQPEKAAAAVFLSTFFALIYIPVMVTYFIEGAEDPQEVKSELIGTAPL